jgi:hypothetical protein
MLTAITIKATIGQKTFNFQHNPRFGTTLEEKTMKKLQQLGQGMTEYIIIVALVAIAGIAIFSFFGQTMQGTVADVATELSGGASANKAAVGAAVANTEADTVEDMGSYDETANNN